MTYQVELTKKAAKQFNLLPAKVRSRLQPKLEALADNPRPSGVVKLEDTDNQYRIRVGTYRIVYEIEDDVLLVLVIKVGHRKDVYKT
jgi:mRNA interferase RelE/StbE